MHLCGGIQLELAARLSLGELHLLPDGKVEHDWVL
jgi:hypothetical protein